MLIAEHIEKAFINNNVTTPVLHNVSLSVKEGEFLSITGRSGSGKSTLLNVLSTLLRPDKGRVLYRDRVIGGKTGYNIDRLRNSDFAMIFQMHHVIPYLTALENVLLPFMKRFAPVSVAAMTEGKRILDRVGLGGKHDRLPGHLSGGEQQRVAIARALITSPSILFADEPTGSLDEVTGRSIMALLRELNEEGLTILMVTHEKEYTTYGTRTREMSNGVLV